MSKYTPVPWIARYLVYTKAYAIVYRTKHGDRRVDAQKDGQFSEEDARLIVRAVNAHGPLLEACKAALGVIVAQTHPNGNPPEVREGARRLAEKLRAAIAAAEEE